MKTFRDSFEENYMPYEEKCSNKRGFRIQYEYVGPWYRYQLEKTEKQRYKRIFLMLCLLSFVFFILASTQKCQFNSRSWAVLFSGFSVAAFLFEWLGVLQFLFSGEKLTNQTFGEMNGILRFVPAVNALLLAGAAGSCMFYMIRSGEFSGSIIVPLLYLLAAGSSGLISFFYRALPYEKQKNDAWKNSSRNYVHM